MQSKGICFVCVIAYFIIAIIEYISKKAHLNKSARKILRQLSKVKSLGINLQGRKTLIKGWVGRYKLSGDKELLKFALNTGLGGRNTQGFGMIEIVGK